MIDVKVKSQIYVGTGLILYTEPEQKPIGGFIVLPTGEIKGGWIAPEYQGQNLVKSQFLKALKEIAVNHISDVFFYYVYDDNKQALSGLDLGWEHQIIGAWHLFFIKKEVLIG